MYAFVFFNLLPVIGLTVTQQHLTHSINSYGLAIAQQNQLTLLTLRLYMKLFLSSELSAGF